MTYDRCYQRTAPGEAEIEIEVTPEMAEAGRKELYGFCITEPEAAEMREAVSAVFRVMLSVAPSAILDAIAAIRLTCSPETPPDIG